MIAVIFGLFLGLLAAALLSLPLALLGPPFQQILPIVAAIVFSYLGIVILSARQNDFRNLFSGRRAIIGNGVQSYANDQIDDFYILLDTSVIIDGRILDISRTGFIRGTLLIPNFILLELQHIADSPIHYGADADDSG